MEAMASSVRALLGRIVGPPLWGSTPYSRVRAPGRALRVSASAVRRPPLLLLAPLARRTRATGLCRHIAERVGLEPRKSVLSPMRRAIALLRATSSLPSGRNRGGSDSHAPPAMAPCGRWRASAAGRSTIRRECLRDELGSPHTLVASCLEMAATVHRRTSTAAHNLPISCSPLAPANPASS